MNDDTKNPSADDVLDAAEEAASVPTETPAVEAQAESVSESDVLSGRVDDLQRALVTAEEEKVALQGEIDAQRALVATAGATEAELRAALEQAAREAEGRPTAEALATLQAELEAAMVAQSSAEATAAEADARAAQALEGAKGAQLEAMTELRNKNAILAKEVVGLTSSLAAMGERAETLKLERDQAQDEIESIKKTIKKARRQTKLLGAGSAFALIWALVKR